MELKQKNRIIKRYLKEKSENPNAVDLQDEDLAPYAGLGLLLDHIGLYKDKLFNLETLETDPNQWREFCGITQYSTVFDKGSPPALKNISITKAEHGIRYTINAHDIIALPKDNYHARPITTPLEVDVDFNHLIASSRAKLYALTQTFPGATPFDATSPLQVITRIIRLQEEIKGLPDSNPEKLVLQKRVTILMDLNKINELKRISIPQERGPALTYCTLAEANSGVTEKVSLVSMDCVKTQLRHLHYRAGGLDVDTYTAERGEYKLSTQAIIKLPKHGNIKEVQREAIALNISRLLGLDTSASISVSYKGHPALFVPFADIRLLSNFASGKKFIAGLGFTGLTYTHYSTIKPVGEGIQADCFINDFGNALGLFYLSNDTDAMGGYCQNKALRDARSLFIFDQVVMDSHKFSLDSRMSLKPDEFFLKHTRHGSGRNRTLIEDSQMNSKYHSIMQLKAMGDKIIQYISHLAWQHHHKGAQIQRQLREPLSDEEYSRLSTQLKDLISLEKDAETLKERIQERIAAIDNVLPKTTGVVSSTEVRQALILEKLIHNPVLFSDDGRPYKNPWTSRQTNCIKKIDDMNNGSVQLTFSDKVPVVMLRFIQQHGGGDSLAITGPKVVTISKVQLAALREDMLHPEHRLALEPATDYLNTDDIAVIKDAYNEGYRTRIIKAISTYRAEMGREGARDVEKMKTITETEDCIKQCIALAKDKGFGMHVLKKFHFDAQQRLQRLINPLQLPANLNEAFVAALKLDRVSEFNAVVLEAIKQNKVTDQKFTDFLDACILRENAATNHTEAQRESLTLSDAAKEALCQLKILPIPLVVQLMAAQPSEDDGFGEIDPLSVLRDDLVEEHHALEEQPLVIAPTIPSSITTELLPQDGIIVSHN